MEGLLLAIFPDGPKLHSRQLSTHLDNSHIHRAKASNAFCAENDIVRVLDPAYSPDFAPLGFWLFGHMKGALTGQEFPESADLLAASGISGRDSEEHVFHCWINYSSQFCFGSPVPNRLQQGDTIANG
jgi:hypothetical protein